MTHTYRLAAQLQAMAMAIDTVDLNRFGTHRVPSPAARDHHALPSPHHQQPPHRARCRSGRRHPTCRCRHRSHARRRRCHRFAHYELLLGTAHLDARHHAASALVEPPPRPERTRAAEYYLSHDWIPGRDPRATHWLLRSWTPHDGMHPVAHNVDIDAALQHVTILESRALGSREPYRGRRSAFAFRSVAGLHPSERNPRTKQRVGPGARLHQDPLSRSHRALCAPSEQCRHNRSDRPHNAHRAHTQRYIDLPHVTHPLPRRPAALPRHPQLGPPHSPASSRRLSRAISSENQPARRRASPSAARVWHPDRPPTSRSTRARLSPRRPNGPTSGQRATAQPRAPPQRAAPACGWHEAHRHHGIQGHAQDHLDDYQRFVRVLSD